MVPIHSVSFVRKSALLDGLSDAVQEEIQDFCLNDFSHCDTDHTLVTLEKFREAVGCDSEEMPEFEDSDYPEEMQTLWERLDELYLGWNDDATLMVDLET